MAGLFAGTNSMLLESRVGTTRRFYAAATKGRERATKVATR
jgi:hypothetical protein